MNKLINFFITVGWLMFAGFLAFGGYLLFSGLVLETMTCGLFSLAIHSQLKDLKWNS